MKGAISFGMEHVRVVLATGKSKGRLMPMACGH